MFTWTPQDYVGGPPIGGASSYGLAFRVKLENATLWNFSPTPPTTSGPLCSQGWVNVTGGCLIGMYTLTLPPNRALTNQRDMKERVDCPVPCTLVHIPWESILATQLAWSSQAALLEVSLYQTAFPFAVVIWTTWH